MATIKDVSKETGLSIGTVSRVLNNRGYISQEAKDRVSQAMKKLNYQPNALARSLSQSSSSVIGVIVPSILHPYFANLVSYIEESAGKADHQILLFQSNGKNEKEAQLIEECRKNRVAGIILCTGRFSTVELKNLDVPVVTIERFQEYATASINCDNFNGGKLAAARLIERGCRSVLNISGIKENTMPADDRTAGFIEICTKAGISHTEIPFTEEVYETMDYRSFISNLLDTYPQTDGIFCTSDIAAAQVLQVCKARGISVPGKMKVIGFDDIPMASMTTPALTTIHQPLKEMASMAVTMIMEAPDTSTAHSVITMTVKLIERESA